MKNKKDMSKEKRRFDRVVYHSAAVLTVNGTDYTVRKIKNLSIGGCLLAVEDKLTVGSECTITIYVDGTVEGLKVSVDGKIIRDDNLLVAIKFYRLSNDSLFYLKEIVKHSTPILKCNPEIQSYLTRKQPKSVS